MRQLKAIVIGLGNIGMGYDYYDDNVTLSHANAFHYHPGFELVAGVDPIKEKQDLFERKFRVQTFANYSECIQNYTDIDIAAIAVPDNMHLEVFEQVVESGVKNIICEKPMGNNLNDSKKIRDITNNYSRYFIEKSYYW